MSEKEKEALEKICRVLPKMSDYQKAKLEGYCERVEEEEREKQSATEDKPE